MDLTKKSESLADKMNKITEKFSESLETADEMILTGEDILDYVEEKTQNVDLYKEEKTPTEIINLDNMVSDFKYVRETLRENTDNGRRVLNAVTLDLLNSDDEKRASLIMSFAELNKAVADNMKLYIIAYKEISNTLLNIDKINAANASKKPTEKGNKGSGSIVSTVDLIRELSDE